MVLSEVNGLVLFHQRHREKDYLVKIFTDQYGKLMFFLRGSKQVRTTLKSVLQPFSYGRFIIDYRDQGLCFLRDAKQVEAMNQIYGDLEKQAHATYLCSLSDAAIEDREPSPGLLYDLSLGIQSINEGMDPTIITNIFEIHAMTYFGVRQEWRACVVCGQTQGTFDYSPKRHGILCPQHFYLDDHRYHASASAIHLIRLFSRVSFDQVSSISISDKNKEELRKVIDQLYEENIGLHLKSKSFIDRMAGFESQVDWSKRHREN